MSQKRTRVQVRNTTCRIVKSFISSNLMPMSGSRRQIGMCAGSQEVHGERGQDDRPGRREQPGGLGQRAAAMGEVSFDDTLHGGYRLVVLEV